MPRLFPVILVAMTLMMAFHTSAQAYAYQNSKLGNPRPKSTQAPPDDYAKYGFICSAENSKNCTDKITHIVISLEEQRLFAFHDNQVIAWSNISTGKTGHDTPTGTFKVTQKHIDHFSNKYNNAPMPYFMRLTDDGVGLHAGNLPGYAASHGCIRLPYAMAQELYYHTPSGTPVTVIAGRVDPNGTSPFEAPSFFAKN
jgi:lipoprotein-anchoring transpeptidase ErfK/SrfK